jgi:hypothetical protein
MSFYGFLGDFGVGLALFGFLRKVWHFEVEVEYEHPGGHGRKPFTIEVEAKCKGFWSGASRLPFPAFKI